VSDVSADLTAASIVQPTSASAASGAHGVAETITATIQSLMAADSGLSALDALLQATETALAGTTRTVIETGGAGGIGTTGGTYAARPSGVTGAVLYVGADNPTTSAAANSGAPALATDVWLPFGAGGTAVTAASIGAATATGLAATNAAVAVLQAQVAALQALNSAVPVNTGPPVITGNLTVGSVLTVSHGIWSGSPTNYLYQWSLTGTPSNDQTYTVVAGDVGLTPTVTEIAVNGNGSSQAALAVAAGVVVASGSGTTVTTPDPGGYTNPFTASVWRTAIPGSPTLSASSAAYVSRFTSDISAYYGTVGININSSCPTRYIVHGNSIPDVTVDITGNGGSYVGTVQCPIPTNAISDPNGTDHEMVIWDVDNQVVYEFWVASKSGTQWSAKTYASESTSTGDGVFARAGNTAGCSASQLSYLGAMITAEDVAAGVIDHAIACAIVSTSGGFVAPATTADGDTSGGVPEGTRFFFPSSVSMPSGLSPLAQMIFTAIKTYGMYLIDTAGAVVVYTENVSAWTNIGLSDPITPSLDGVASYEAITGFPWASMEALVAP
jgi:hypothetical protein